MKSSMSSIENLYLTYIEYIHRLSYSRHIKLNKNKKRKIKIKRVSIDDTERVWSVRYATTDCRIWLIGKRRRCASYFNKLIAFKQCRIDKALHARNKF